MSFHPSSSLIGALAYTAGVVGEVVHLLTSPSRWGRAGVIGTRCSTSPISLRQAIFGHTKRDVAFRLGPPRAAAGSRIQGVSSFWHANTWYYPFDPRRHTAMVVQFSDDRAVSVEFLGAPPSAAKPLPSK